jgi:hypothetical protein
MPSTRPFIPIPASAPSSKKYRRAQRAPSGKMPAPTNLAAWHRAIFQTCPKAPIPCISSIVWTCLMAARHLASKLNRPINRTKPSKNAFALPLVVIKLIIPVKPAPKPLILSRSNYCSTAPYPLLAPSGCQTTLRTSTLIHQWVGISTCPYNTTKPPTPSRASTTSTAKLSTTRKAKATSALKSEKGYMAYLRQAG